MRRRRAPKREMNPDPKFNSLVVGQFVNIIMSDGKKSIAQRIIYDAFDVITEKVKEDPLKVFFAALDNARPRMAVKPRRIGGATYQVPLEVPKERGVSMALRWMKAFAVKKKGKDRTAYARSVVVKNNPGIRWLKIGLDVAAGYTGRVTKIGSRKRIGQRC